MTGFRGYDVCDDQHVGRPATGQTPVRHIRIGDGLWNQVRQIADEQGRPATAVVIDALKRYIVWYQRQASVRAGSRSE
jgi:predicted transcriptional regulator